jgi:hypothetical protein
MNQPFHETGLHRKTLVLIVLLSGQWKSGYLRMITMSETRLLTKTEFIRGLDCVRRAWLDLHRPDLKAPLSLASRDRMETGKLIGELARARYSGGQMASNSGSSHDIAVAETLEKLQAGHRCLFEATFVASGRLARLDVLHQADSGDWTLDEVKSSSVKEPKKIAEDKVLDLAFQFHTTRDAGHPVKYARLVLVDTSCVWDGGAFNPNSLLGVVDLTDVCEESAARITDHSTRLSAVLASDSEPDVELNTHCKDCDYFDHCHADSPKHDLIFLPRITAKAVNDLRAKGYRSITDIPEDEKLTDARKRMRDVVVSGEPYIGDGLKSSLEAIPFPAAFIDYESSNPAFPMYPGTRPYQQICFQWSAHLLALPDSEPSHHEFLPKGSEDPRPGFCQSLWETIKDCKSIVHYTHFEKTQLKSMVADGIPYAQELLDAIEARSVDLEKIVSEHVYLEGFKGRTSIKVVLPTLVPSMSYKDLLIADGTAAAAGFRKMLSPNTTSQEAAELRRALLDYCCQDTLAMVEIYQALKRLARSE